MLGGLPPADIQPTDRIDQWVVLFFLDGEAGANSTRVTRIVVVVRVANAAHTHEVRGVADIR